MHEAQKAAFKKLEDSGYLKSIREFAMARCAPFFWTFEPGGDQPVRFRNGTICYVDTGEKTLGITANHVYTGEPSYLSDLEAYNGSVHAQFGGNTIYPEKRFIAGDKKLDIATFDVPPVFVSASEVKVIHKPATWPPPPLQQGELVIYGGYPGALKEPGTNEIVWPFQSFTWKVTDVTETNIVLHVDFPNLYWPGHEEEKINDVLGGVSGGPVFRIIEIPEGTQMRVRFELVGIVYEVHESLQVVRARHIQHIRADGSLISI